ncbi:molybdenum cofactor synthesis domain-containing protein [Alicyclobacillus hesperidum URH17-3-68]|uniref:Molybdopterin molybdenumtransferase n=1 Tax=Alicyclobacillus hesperidum TaxID=89784 RepID=A0A1H2Q0I0_9BACL|nr:molybdopterin molybdotransferase MoeA [Alicyclobacillus hesperidum]EJY56350.1 molybdenum cofactor synthesis domain-containing protein [Alicyclobacillus hesperidum URH17-3-68]GLV12875.1 molybdopterin molybdenumtransferase MoeA [Alicyclobacillus hesperidum]SDW00633.1 molybdopterin molybdochelatase [Alicyclobacillus hesperidum]
MRILPFDDAWMAIQSLSAPLPPEWIEVWQATATKRRIAQDVVSAIDLPPFDRAMMDGFAIAASDLNAMEPLFIRGAVAAGDPAPITLANGDAVRVRTGAMVPSGAAAVVRQEWVDVQGETIRLLQRVRPNESIQRRGDDVRRGAPLIGAGLPLDGQTIAVLRAAGVTKVPIHRACRIAILVTGSELRTGKQPLATGQVYAASDAFLAASLSEMGAIVVDIVYLPDDFQKIRDEIERRIGAVDCILMTGGASVGDTDYAQRAIASIPGDLPIAVSRIWMRPGSPLVVRRIDTTNVFAMSGNPAACFVQFHSLILPAIRRMMGDYSACPFPYRARLMEPIRLKPLKHVRLHRAIASWQDGILTAKAQVQQSSGSISGLASTNALIRLDEDQYVPGDTVPLSFTRGLGAP